MYLVDGRKIAENILASLKLQVESLDFRPVFCDILIGDDPVSLSYIGVKRKKVEQLGMEFLFTKLPADSSTIEVVAEIGRLQQNIHLCGLILQLPLPAGLDKQRILDAITPELDVDCLSQANLQAFYSGYSILNPPTAGAIIHILDSLNIDLTEKSFLVVGQGELVGKPVTYLLKQRGYQVSTADKSTQDLKQLSTTADIIISGTGRPGLITGDMIKSGAVVIDAGTAESEGSIVGDVDSESVGSIASILSPVPGGVGPITVAKLLENTVRIAKQKSV